MVVTTLAGNSNILEVDGTGTSSTFNDPWGLALDASSGNLYVTTYIGNTIRLITMPGGINIINCKFL